MNKQCTKCMGVKPLSAFCKDKRNGSGYGARCKACMSIVSGVWRKNNKQRHRQSISAWAARNKDRRDSISLKSYLNVKYGISLLQYNELLAEQDGLCAICKGSPVGKSALSDRLSVDHSHASGKVRGLLCLHCNAGLGNFKDNIELLQAAIEYLRNNDG